MGSIHGLGFDVISLLSDARLSAPLYLQCNPSPKTLIEDIINRSTWYGVDVNVLLNSWERYHWCKSHCNAPIGKGVWPRCCNGCLSSLINVHHFSLPLLLLVLTCKCPPLLLVPSPPPLNPTPTRIQACWQDNAHGFIGHLQKSTSSQFEASQYRESDPNPASPPFDPHKDCSHSKRCQSIKDFESFQTVWFYFFCCFLIEIALFSLRPPICCLLPILSHFLWPLDVPLFPHCEPLGPIQCATNTHKHKYSSANESTVSQLTVPPVNSKEYAF